MGALLAAALAPLIATLLVQTGCASKKESKVAHDVRVIHEENAPSKLFEKGRQFHAVGDLNRAEQYYAAAMQQGFPEKQVLPLLLRVCIDANRFQVAIDYAEPALKKNPADHRLRLVIASLYSAIGQPSKAREHYQAVIEGKPEDATAHYALAVLLRDEFGDRVGADRHFREYLRIDPAGTHADEAKASLLKPVQPPSGPVDPNAPPTPLPTTTSSASTPTPASSAPPPPAAKPLPGAAPSPTMPAPPTKPGGPTKIPPKPVDSSKP